MIRIISLTDAGRKLAIRIEQILLSRPNQYKDNIQHHHKPSPFSDSIQAMFTQGDRLVLICAMGIAVRTLGPVLKNKYEDPAVLVLDEAGRFVVPLLSGHEGGANDWAAELALALNGEAIITTAKPYLKPVYTLGMGCERDCPKQDLLNLMDQCLEKANLSLTDIHSLNSIDIKADEVGLIQLADEIGKPFHTWSREPLSKVEHLLSVRSEYVFNTVGVYGVAESAALVGASHITQDVAELVLVKHKNAKATCSIARSYPLPE